MPPDGPSLGDWVAELKRRRVFRVAAVYAGVGFVLVQATAYAFEALLFPEWAHRLFVVLVMLGFPVALVLAWAFELTPEGIRTTSRPLEGEDEGGDAAVTSSMSLSRALVPVALVAVFGTAVAAAGWGAWETWLAPESTRSAAGVEAEDAGAELSARRIAVLYFDDHSEGQELGHVAAGFTEALIHELNRAPGLDVVSRHGVKPYRNPDVSPDSIARALGAGSLVEGSVERQGNDLEVTVQLIDGATASHLLSERVRGRVDAPLEVRNELVEKVADLLRRRLGQEVQLRQARAGTESSRAWELYHLGRDIRSDADSFRREGDAASARQLYLQADSVLAEAERRDSEWRSPTLQRGEIAMSLGRVGSPEVTESKEEWLNRGIEHANRILAEDPNDAAALELRGELRYYLARTQQSSVAQRTVKAAEQDLRRAVSVDPERAAAWARLAYLLWNQQARFAEARSAIRRSRDADPFLIADRDYLFVRASLALDLEEFDRTGRLLREALEAYPEDPSFLYKRLQYLASTASSPDAVDEAWRTLERFESVTRTEPWAPGRALVAAVAARSDMADSATAVLGRVEGSSTLTPAASVNVAFARLQLGEEEKALDHLSRYLEANPGQRDYVSKEWWWRPLRDHPRFAAMVSDTAGSSPGEAASASDG